MVSGGSNSFSGTDGVGVVLGVGFTLLEPEELGFADDPPFDCDAELLGVALLDELFERVGVLLGRLLELLVELGVALGLFDRVALGVGVELLVALGVALLGFDLVALLVGRGVEVELDVVEVPELLGLGVLELEELLEAPGDSLVETLGDGESLGPSVALSEGVGDGSGSKAGP